MKKLMRRLMSVVAAVAMVLTMAMPVAAQSVGTAKETNNGSITISNPTKGQEYKVFKLFGATTNGTTTTAATGTAYTGEIPDALRDIFEKDASDNITAKASALDTIDTTRLSSAAVTTITNWAKDLTENSQYYITKATSNGSKPLTFTGLDYGYYIVTSGLGSAISVDSVNPNPTIEDKNTENPDNKPEKTITKVTDPLKATDNASTTVDDKDVVSAKVGDTVSYKVTFTATNYDADNNFIHQYVVEDTPTNFVIDTTTVKVSIKQITGTDADGNKTYGAEQYAAGTHDFQATTTNGKTTITIPWGQQAAEATETEEAKIETAYYNAPALVTVTYDARLTSTSGSNSATVHYNENQPGTSDTTDTKTADFTIKKVNSSNEELTGAEFDLYEVKTTAPDKTTTDDNANAVVVGKDNLYKTSVVTASDGAFVRVPVTKNDDGNYTVQDTKAENVTVSTAKIEAGEVKIKGLKADTTYYLVETKAPDGYKVPTYAFEIKTGVLDETTKVVTAANSDILNTEGSELPSTGGMGTTIFYVLGAALVIGAGVVLVTRRRLSR